MSQAEQRIHPVLPTFASTKGTGRHANMTEAALTTIRAGLMQCRYADRMPLPSDLPELSAIVGCYPHERSYISLGIIAASNGFVLSKSTRGWLADYSHQLTVPLDGAEPEYDCRYRKQAFNVDAQCLTPRPVDLVGIKEIAGDTDAVIQVLDFERDILRASILNWQKGVHVMQPWLTR